MNTTSRIISGGLLILIGSIIIGIMLISADSFLDFYLLIYGIPIIILGLIILFNKKEDEIEKIKK